MRGSGARHPVQGAKSDVPLTVTQPRLAAVTFYFPKPFAGGVKHQHDENPDEIHDGQSEAIVRRNRSFLRAEWAAEHPIGPAVTQKSHYQCEPVNEWQVQQIKEQRHTAKDENWPKQS